MFAVSKDQNWDPKQHYMSPGKIEVRSLERYYGHIYLAKWDTLSTKGAAINNLTRTGDTNRDCLRKA